MTAVNGNGTDPYAPVEHVSSSTYGAAARCVARVVVGAVEACDEADVPLSELQRVTILEAALLEFDGFGAHLASLAAVERLIRELRYG